MQLWACTARSSFNPRARMGRDTSRTTLSNRGTCFNPRARMGRDVGKTGAAIKALVFSIHAPAWGATVRICECMNISLENIHYFEIFVFACIRYEPLYAGESARTLQEIPTAWSSRSIRCIKTLQGRRISSSRTARRDYANSCRDYKISSCRTSRQSLPKASVSEARTGPGRGNIRTRNSALAGHSERTSLRPDVAAAPLPHFSSTRRR